MMTPGARRGANVKPLSRALPVIAALAAVLAIAAACGSPDHHAAAPATPSAVATPSPPAPTLKPAEARFVSDIRPHLVAGGYSNSATDAQIASIGNTLCQVAETSGPALAAQMLGAKAEADFSYTGKQVVALA